MDAPTSPPKGALGTLFLIVFMDLVGFGIILPLLPRYVPDYAAHAQKVTLLFSVYSICQFIGAPVLGMISDRAGRRPVLILSQLGSVVGYVLLGIATDWGHHTLMLVYFSRIIDGFTGGNISTAQAYISDVTAPEKRAKAMGLLGAAFGIGFAVGPAIGGLLGEHHTSWPAYLAAIMSAGAAFQTWLRLPETRTHAKTDAEVWFHPGRFAPILRKPVLVQLLSMWFFVMTAFVMMEATIVLFLDRTFHMGVRATGWYFLFIGIIIIIVQGGFIGRLTRRFGEWPLAAAGPIFVGLGMCGLTTTAYVPLLSILMVAGAVNALGRSLHQPTLSSLVSKYSDRGEQGTVFGLYHGLGSMARVAGPALAGVLYPYFHNAAQFVVAGMIAVSVGIWTALLRHPPVNSGELAGAEGLVEGG